MPQGTRAHRHHAVKRKYKGSLVVCGEKKQGVLFCACHSQRAVKCSRSSTAEINFCLAPRNALYRRQTCGVCCFFFLFSPPPHHHHEDLLIFGGSTRDLEEAFVTLIGARETLPRAASVSFSGSFSNLKTGTFSFLPSGFSCLHFFRRINHFIFIFFFFLPTKPKYQTVSELRAGQHIRTTAVEAEWMVFTKGRRQMCGAAAGIQS